MKRYIGLDVHAASTTFAVIDARGKRVSGPHVVETNGLALVAFIKTVPGETYVCLEEGTQSAWIYEILSPHATEVVVVAVSRIVSINGLAARIKPARAGETAGETAGRCGQRPPAGPKHSRGSRLESAAGPFGTYRAYRSNATVVCPRLCGRLGVQEEVGLLGRRTGGPRLGDLGG